MLEIGSLIDGKYKVLSVIGKGGMSVVYLVINEKANKSWAIKEVRRDGLKDFEVVRQGLIVETDLLKKLSHPNLPSIIDVIEEDDTLLIVMDYIEGKPLSDQLQEYGAQKQEDVIFWAKQMCDVLIYLHTRQPAIIYRDMKPSNIMLKPDGNLVLIDFGIAREFKERNVADTISLGTIGYAAPEQFGGRGQTDARTDIYGLGATMYHLITGRNPCEPPYEKKPIRQINPALSSGLEKIILKCTKENPDERYQSAAELMYALEHFEEIDDQYRKKQKKKLHAFIACSVLSVFFFIVGFAAHFLAVQTATDDYNDILEQAAIESNPMKKTNMYVDAIAIKPEQKEAYDSLIEICKDDSSFSSDEEQKLISVVKNNKASISENTESYADICFNIGKLYWYYYDYGNGEDNRTNRMKTAINWFGDSIDYGGETFADKDMAMIYQEIGTFYRDVPTKAIEGDDKGMYRPLYDELTALIEMVKDNENESEIVPLELYELARYSMMQYATKFKGDEVSKEELLNLYNEVENDVQKVQTTTEKTDELQQQTISLLPDTKKAIEVAYDTVAKTEESKQEEKK